MSLNTYLLSTFSKNARFAPDLKSSASRFQTLAIIYLNFIVISVIVGYELIVWCLLHLPNALALSSIGVPGFIISLFLLKKGRQNAAASTLLFYMHCSTFCAGNLLNVPLAGLFAILPFVNVAYLLTPSPLARNINTMVCVCQILAHARNTYKIFEVTLNEEQHIQVVTGIICSLIIFKSLAGIVIVQKTIEDNLWSLAESNYSKSENLTKELVQAMEAKDIFVSSLSHEIRNPLNALTGSIEYLIGSVKEPNHLKMLRNAKIGGEVLLNLINNVLDAAKLKADKMELNYSETDFEHIIEKVFTIHSEKLKLNNITAQAFIDKNIPKELWLDPSRILQIVMNLMSNALKFTPKGGKITIRANWCLTKFPEVLTEIKNPHVFCDHNDEKSVQNFTESDKNLPTADAFEEFSFSEGISRIQNFTKLHSENRSCLSPSHDHAAWTIIRTHSSSHHSEGAQKTGYLKVQVSDSGCGIAQEEISSLFGMFNQVKTEARHVSGGSGLGLWICKQLCQKMNGEITVYSKVNQGTSFVFYIPASSEKGLRDFATGGGGQKRDKVNALVVDDLEFNRNLHKVLLEREGVQVTLASDGEEAVEKYKRKGHDYFDFIMMDAQMPGIDGFGAATMIREWEDEKKFNKVDIYFVSGEYFNEAEVFRELKKQGRTQDFGDIKCLRKPVDIHIIGNIVESVRTKLNLRNSRGGSGENFLL